MASSSGNSSGSTQLQNSGSDEDLQVLMDQRKRKRMQSNRESARRSRLRKQQHLDELMGQVAQLRKENNQIMTSISITTQHLMSVGAENSVLRAQMAELIRRLQSLNDIINYINDNNNDNDNSGGGWVHHLACDQTADSFMMNQMNLVCLNQPMVATADIFPY
ncbi:Basic-leucine zipper transcription factor [Parasponia andersonii]|uniref:Basic-leucine zipper transcription factor n=1 Tax=Parasponia andersonii TaxID=3476 RepID=A0A2P5C1L4_PARAD|nr:Basic-leucine zipper transcription factor [Parasponia andersonii]